MLVFSGLCNAPASISSELETALRREIVGKSLEYYVNCENGSSLVRIKWMEGLLVLAFLYKIATVTVQPNTNKSEFDVRVVKYVGLVLWLLSVRHEFATPGN